MTLPSASTALAESCSWATDKFCYLTSLLNDDTQYITWGLVFIGWFLTVVIAVVQHKKGNKTLRESSHNEWVREFREKLEKLEDEALRFWTTDTQELSDTITITKLTRNVKEITTIARDIKNVGGVNYPQTLFKELRQSVTNDQELSSRPLSDTHFRVVAIKTACSNLRRAYRRKST
ncbi:Uncharacterised protein [Vibrio cholerae]|uniref:hypothetical protein n=1 Tax=Vibrio cholerae TaxID=666 RepID=UPI0006644B14|nr:hypothetical protein [Vibrio cholerae]ELD1800498.1 hypothetical protein [Vibrio fluvialis]EGQ9396092.1 hypothetical protein [Vibrio cholerae]EGR2405650.1 hypothetical protein [Vibrio cholerae]EJL6332930.1 hypothetical protein [Vibrio cholerae]EJO4031980.1 hypothetical protein [Vibrio cholerae]